MLLTVIAGVIIAIVILGAIAGLSESSPGCAGWLIVGVALFALSRCL